MLSTFRRLILGLVLIAATSALLLLSDLRSRIHPTSPSPTPATETAQPARKVRVALLQHASQAILDQGREGILAALKHRGWTVGDNLDLKIYNAEGDMSVGQNVAKEMAGGHYDLLLTISTPSLQAVANANKTTRTPHVFGLVTDPFIAGIGAHRENPLDHPEYIAGYGTMQPVALSFKIAREMNPALKTVGCVWNAGEANSEAQVKLARKVCADLGITLLESSIENSAGVGEAAAALVARGAEAIWVGGDITVMTAIETVIAAAQRGHIPVFTVVPPNIKRGVLFDLGANYFEVGQLVGDLAGEILNGRSPASVPIENRMPENFTLNLKVAAELGGKWNITPAMIQRATAYIDAAGAEHTKAIATATTPAVSSLTASPALAAVAAAPKTPNPSGKKWKLALILYNETPPAEELLHGMEEGWKHSPLVAGRDYEIKLRSAQGDIAALNGIIDAALTDGADIIVPLSTPTLQIAVQRVKRTPILFSLVANPMAAGAGKSYTDHLPNVTGVAVLAPFGEMLDFLTKHFPQYKRFGTLFCPAEANSVDLKNSLEALCKQRGITLVTVAANSAGELPDAAMALAGRDIDAIVQISDNLSSAGFTAITRAARQAKKPLFSLNNTTVPQGAAVGMGRDYRGAGEATVTMLERLIAGEDTAKMPFILPPRIFSVASPANAAAVGLTLPPALLKEVDKVVP